MSKLSRQQSMQAIPVPASIAEEEELDGGGVKLSVMVATRPMQRKILRLPEHVKREYELDVFGREVFGLCNGKNTVADILKQFCKKNKLPPQEGETAVLTFIRTLVAKGLIVVTLKD
jgi:hypothetical protein